jgi:hypothetical protein
MHVEEVARGTLADVDHAVLADQVSLTLLGEAGAEKRDFFQHQRLRHEAA